MSASAFVGYYGRGTRLRLTGPAYRESKRTRQARELAHANAERKAELRAEYAARKLQAADRAAEHKAQRTGFRGFVGKLKALAGRVLGRRGA